MVGWPHFRFTDKKHPEVTRVLTDSSRLVKYCNNTYILGVSPTHQQWNNNLFIWKARGATAETASCCLRFLKCEYCSTASMEHWRRREEEGGGGRRREEEGGGGRRREEEGGGGRRREEESLVGTCTFPVTKQGQALLKPWDIKDVEMEEAIDHPLPEVDAELDEPVPMEEVDLQEEDLEEGCTNPAKEDSMGATWERLVQEETNVAIQTLTFVETIPSQEFSSGDRCCVDQWTQTKRKHAFCQNCGCW